MRNELRRNRLGYLLAGGLTALVVVFAFVAGDQISRATSLLLLILAVVAAAYSGGLRPGLFATILGAIAGVYFFLSPRDQEIPGDSAALSHLIFFIGLGLLISWLYESSHTAQQRLSIYAGEQQFAKESAEAWKERYEAAVKASGSILYDSNRRTGQVVYGGDCEAILGYTRDELGGDISKWISLIHPDDRDIFTREVDRTSADLTSYQADYRMTRKDGKTIWLRDDGHFTFRSSNQPSERIIGLVRDVSQQRENERKMEILSQRLETLIDNTPLAVIEWDSDFRITRWSGQVHRTFGWSADEIVGKTIADLPFVSRTDLPQFKSSIEHLNTSDKNFVVFTSDNVQKGGREIACQWYNSALHDSDGRMIAVLSLILDITERNEAEAERERVQLVADAVPALISYIDADTRYCLINRAYETWFGAERGEMIGREMREVIGEAAWEAILPQVDSVLAGNLVTYEAQVPYRNGGTRWISATYTPDLCKDGKVRGFVAHVNDITARHRAEDELKYQRSLLQAITDNAQTSIFLMDEEGRGLFVNPAAEEMTGYSASELLGNRLSQVIHRSPDPQALYSSGDCPLLGYGAPIEPVRNQTDVFVHRDGRVYPVLWNARTVFRDGKAIATVAEVWDVTKEKQAEQDLQAARHSLETIIETAPTLIVLINTKGEICMFNRACELLTGYTRDEVIGQKMLELLVPNGDAQLLFERFSAAEMDELDEPHENHWVTRTGEHRLVEWRCTRLNPGGAEAESMLLGIGVDVTSRRAMEDELRDQAERLAETDRRKDEFIATLAHELRNPLAPIRMGLELLKMTGNDPATLESTRMMMERQTLQLITLVDDLLDVSRITRGKLELRRCTVALSEVIQSAVEACRPGTAEAGHDLQVIVPPEPVYLQADPNRLAQVLSNLLNNASKYTPPGGRIRVVASCEGGQVSIVVEDNGVGIPVAMQQQIFDMFAQIDRSIERGYTGLGIGLTLVRSLVEMHGGTIEVYSEGVDCGSRFTVTIPVGNAAVQSVDPLDRPPLADNLRTCRVIVVDDNKAAVDLLSQVVRLQGHEVRVANNGEEAIEIATQFLPHAILMDIGMPRMDGYEAARVIRGQPWGKDILLVALTGWGQVEDRRRTKEAGFDCHLVKPAEPAEIARLLSLSRRP